MYGLVQAQRCSAARTGRGCKRTSARQAKYVVFGQVEATLSDQAPDRKLPLHPAHCKVFNHGTGTSTKVLSSPTVRPSTGQEEAAKENWLGKLILYIHTNLQISITYDRFNYYSTHGRYYWYACLCGEKVPPKDAQKHLLPWD